MNLKARAGPRNVAEGTEMPEQAQRPVDEVVLSVAFDRVDALGSPYLGTSVPSLLNQFPSIESQPVYEMQLELPPTKTGIGGTIGIPQFVLRAGQPETRLWLTSPGDETRLVQVQADYAALNWRRRGDDVRYPGYSRMREEFQQVVGTIDSALNERSLPPLAPRQAELTYINIVDPNELWEDHSEMINVIRLELPADGPIEQFTFGYSKAVSDSAGRFMGRLHLSVQPAVRLIPNQGPVINMTVTIRSAKLSDQGVPAALAFLDAAHDEATAAFRAVLSEAAMQLWEFDRDS